MRHTPELELDRALELGWPVEDPTVADLNDLASRVEHWLTCEPPPARQERALFAAGVVGARRARPSRAFKPAIVAAALLVTLGWVGRDALPGETLYPVRQVLGSVGLAPSMLEEIDKRIVTARAKVESAESALDNRPALAERLARNVISDLNDATRLLGEVGEQTGRRPALIAGLELRAARVIEQALDALGIADLSGAKVESNGRIDDRRERASESNESDDADDDGPNGGNAKDDDGPNAGNDSDDDGPNGGDDSDDDGPESNEDDANEGQDQDDATGDGKDDGATVSDRDGDDPDEPEVGDANDTGDGDGVEDIDPNDLDDAEPDQEAVD
jgi:hypothetical protein